MEAGVHQYYQDQPVVTLGLDIYNGSAALVEQFRDVTGVTFPLLTMAGTYGTQNNANYRKVVIDADGIVRYASAPYMMDIPAIRTRVDEWLPLDEPTFTFEMEETDQIYSDGNATFTWHAVVTNLLDAERNLTLEITPLVSPDSLRGYAICTYLTCLPPDTGYQNMTIPYAANQRDTLVSTYVYNMAFNPELGFFDVSPVFGDYVLRFTVLNPEDTEEQISYDLHLNYIDGITPRIEPVPFSSALIRNYPNPFNPETTIQFVVSNPGAVKLNVFNMLGQNVSTLIDAPFMSTGNYTANWKAVSAQGLPLPSGSYLLELNNAGYRAVHKIVLAR